MNFYDDAYYNYEIFWILPPNMELIATTTLYKIKAVKDEIVNISITIGNTSTNFVTINALTPHQSVDKHIVVSL